MKKKILIVLGVLVLIGVGYGLKEFMRTRPDSKSVTPKFTVTAVDIIKEFESNEAAATKKYLAANSIIQVSGEVKDIKQDEKGYYTVMLGTQESMSTVQCSMDTLYTADLKYLKPQQKATIKGVFTGFNSDDTGLLGSDVKLNLCVLVIDKNQ